MITELMIITTAVGAAIVLLVWISNRRRKNKELERKEIADSTERFKKDLESTANEIINRMEGQASQIENLLDDTTRDRTQLEGRIVELKKLLKKTEGQSTEIKDLLARLDDAVEDVSLMKRQIELVERKLQAVQKLPLPSAEPAQIEPPTVTIKAQETAPPISKPIEVRATQAENFAKVLEQSMQAPEPSNPAEKKVVPFKPPVVKKIDVVTDSVTIRDMLLSGMTIEEVSRKTKLGRSAIELVQQMMRRQLERS